MISTPISDILMPSGKNGLSLYLMRLARRRNYLIAALMALAAASLPAGPARQKVELSEEVEAYVRSLPFAMPAIRLPRIPDRTVSVLEHGAVADGQTLNTRAFADAIRACASAGGGTVVVPPGVWLTGPIKMESNINLHVMLGAVVIFSRRFEDYPLIQRPDSMQYLCASPIYGFNLENIAISGRGTFDGSGEGWRPMKREKQTAAQWNQLVASGGVVTPDGKTWWPSTEAMNGEQYLAALAASKKELTPEEYAAAREYLRPDMISLVRCRRVLLDGPTFQNSPKFCIHPVQCEDLVIREVNVRNPWYAQNGDGIDIGSSRNVLVYRTTVDAGDDAICLKPGTMEKGAHGQAACENIVVADCTVYHGHGGFVIGSETFGSARNVCVRNCFFSGTDVGLRFKSARGRGGIIEKIFIEGIRMKDIANEAILFDTFYGSGSPESNALDVSSTRRKKEGVTERTPRFRNFRIQNILCNGAGRAVLVMGLPEMAVQNIAMTDLVIEARKGILTIDADEIAFTKTRIISASSPTIAVNHSRNITLTDVAVPDDADPFLKVAGDDSGGITLSRVNLSGARQGIVLGENVRKEAVIQK
jgi:polygalacturonase